MVIGLVAIGIAVYKKAQWFKFEEKKSAFPKEEQSMQMDANDMMH